MPCKPMSHSILQFSEFLIFRGFNNVFIFKLSRWLSLALNKISLEKWVTWRWYSDKTVRGIESPGL